MRYLASWGFDVKTFLSAISRARDVRSESKEFWRLSEEIYPSHEFPQGLEYRVYSDYSKEAGVANGHYFHQDLWVARKVFRNNPRRHIDVGSSIAGLVSHIASFRTIEVLDIRPLKNETQGITFVQSDLMNYQGELDCVADSLSCLHALEHFGLGRYGDEINPEGWRLGLIALTKILEPGGTLYLSVPTGKFQRVEFNAHRVFSIPFLRDVFHLDFEIADLLFVDDSGRARYEVDPWGADSNESFNAAYGLSVWELTKK
jgi:hypothetical protein